MKFGPDVSAPVFSIFRPIPAFQGELRRPASAKCLFLKDFWRIEGGAPGLGGFEPPFSQSLETLPLPALQQKTDPVQVRREDGQAHRSLEPGRALGPNPIEASLLQIVDRRFHCRMTAPGQNERRSRFSRNVSYVKG